MTRASPPLARVCPVGGGPDEVDGPRTRVDMGSSEVDVPTRDETLQQTHDEVAAAIAAAEASSQPTGGRGDGEPPQGSPAQ